MSDTMAVDLTDLDLFVRNEHHGVLAWLREHDPVHRHPLGDGAFWALTRYDDVLRAYRDHTTFSSSSGAILGGSFRSETDTAAGRMLVASDLPRQRLLRQQMHPVFATGMVERVRRQVDTLVGAALDRLLSAGGGDVATEIAPELPAGALMTMVDIGRTDALELVSLTRRMIGFQDPSLVGAEDDEARLRLAWLQSEIFEYFADLIRERRARPGDDLVSILLRAEINGRRLPDEDILYNCMNVAVGGNETSSYTTCAGIAALMEYPDQYDRLLAQPELLDLAMEEILRWGSTNAYVQRVATRDATVGGREIRRGDSVTLWNVSANRDERQFPHADRFDIGRSPNRHLTFGSGIHRCVGAPVGMVELTSVFGPLTRRGIRLEKAGPVRRLRSNFILGITALPVTVTVSDRVPA